VHAWHPFRGTPAELKNRTCVHGPLQPGRVAGGWGMCASRCNIENLQWCSWMGTSAITPRNAVEWTSYRRMSSEQYSGVLSVVDLLGWWFDKRRLTLGAWVLAVHSLSCTDRLSEWVPYFTSERFDWRISYAGDQHQTLGFVSHTSAQLTSVTRARMLWSALEALFQSLPLSICPSIAGAMLT